MMSGIDRPREKTDILSYLIPMYGSYFGGDANSITHLQILVAKLLI